eukprot:g82507.t1
MSSCHREILSSRDQVQLSQNDLHPFQNAIYEWAVDFLQPSLFILFRTPSMTEPLTFRQNLQCFSSVTRF